MYIQNIYKNNSKKYKNVYKNIEYDIYNTVLFGASESSDTGEKKYLLKDTAYLSNYIEKKDNDLYKDILKYSELILLLLFEEINLRSECIEFLPGASKQILRKKKELVYEEYIWDVCSFVHCCICRLL